MHQNHACSIEQIKGPQKRLLPSLVLYTQTGSIPFLSWNFIQQFGRVLFKDDVRDNDDSKFLIKLNVGDFMDLLDEDQRFDLHLMKYFQTCSLLLAQFDPFKSEKLLKSTQDQVPIPTVQGKKMLSVEAMLKLAKILNVEHCQAIADINTPPIAQRKWTDKSVGRSVKFLENTLNMVSVDQPSNFGIPKIWATVSGGFNQTSRIKSCEQVAKHSSRIEAVIIDGFCGYSPLALEKFEDCEKLLRETVLPNLPKHLPKALFGAFYPDDMLRLFNCGINILDSSICTVLTQKGLAFPSPLISIDKDFKHQFRFYSTMSTESIVDPTPVTILNLKHEAFSGSKLVLSHGCQCYTCHHGFTRAYINHLLKRNEINASILLQIHNHYVLTEFVHQIRAMTDDQFDQIINEID